MSVKCWSIPFTKQAQLFWRKHCSLSHPTCPSGFHWSGHQLFESDQTYILCKANKAHMAPATELRMCGRANLKWYQIFPQIRQHMTMSCGPHVGSSLTLVVVLSQVPNGYCADSISSLSCSLLHLELDRLYASVQPAHTDVMSPL